MFRSGHPNFSIAFFFFVVYAQLSLVWPVTSFQTTSGPCFLKLKRPSLTDLKVAFGDNFDGHQTLDEMLRPSIDCDAKQLSPASLAYIGDVVFELFTRSKCVWPLQRMADLQANVVSIVRAEYQSELLQKLGEEFEWTTEEKTIIGRGRNGGTKRSPKRFSQGSEGTPSTYRESTAFEAILGYLYITNPKKCEAVLNWINCYMDTPEVIEEKYPGVIELD